MNLSIFQIIYQSYMLFYFSNFQVYQVFVLKFPLNILFMNMTYINHINLYLKSYENIIKMKFFHLFKLLNIYVIYFKIIRNLK